MAQIKLSDYLVQTLVNKGVRTVFMLTGGAAMHLNDSVGKEKKIKYVCTHHEQSAAMAAESYARVKNDLGVCLVTCGPGGTNTITGVAGAWLDSLPVLFISGQVKRNDLKSNYPGLRQLGVQEVNIVEIVKSITKLAVTIVDPNEIAYYLEKAIFLSKKDRPGPVWLDIPLDIQASMIDTEKLKKFYPEEIENKVDKILLHKQILLIIELLKKAKRPVVIGGLNIHTFNLLSPFRKVIDTLRIPVVATMTAHDLIPYDSLYYGGRCGLFGDRQGNFTIQNSDLVISLNSRLAMWETGYDFQGFAPRAKKVVVDIDESEFKKPTMKPDLAIKVDLATFLEEFDKEIEKNKIADFSGWVKQTMKWKTKYPVALPEYKELKNKVNSYHFIDILSSVLDKDEIIVTGVGTSFTGTSQSIKLKTKQRLCMNIGCAAMGYDLPAAIGAHYASLKKRIVLIVGDGGIQLNIQELQTIAGNNLPIKIFILNNLGYLAIRITQKAFFEKRYVGSSLDSGLSFPSFKKIAQSYGISYCKIANHTNLKNKIKKTLNSKGPVICEIMMDSEQQLIPKVTSIINKNKTMSTMPLEDQYPFLERKEFLNNMISYSSSKRNET